MMVMREGGREEGREAGREGGRGGTYPIFPGEGALAGPIHVRLGEGPLGRLGILIINLVLEGVADEGEEGEGEEEEEEGTEDGGEGPHDDDDDAGGWEGRRKRAGRAGVGQRLPPLLLGEPLLLLLLREGPGKCACVKLCVVDVGVV